jgi:peptide/nickel transport system permease protein
MVRFIIRRLLGSLGVLVVASLVAFAIFFLIPSNPAVLYSGRTSSPATIQATKVRLGLNDPAYEQYYHYMKGIVAGRDFSSGPGDTTHCPVPCLGYSFKSNQPVTTILWSRLPVTFSIIIGAAILWLISGVAIGVLSALKRGTVVDRGSMIVALVGVSLPVFFTGLILLKLFSYNWNILPNVHYVNFRDDPLNWARNLILPWIALAFLFSALYARLTRATTLETMSEDYIRTARAKGLRERTVIGKHTLRAVLTPIVTIFGLDLAQGFTGAILTEKAFGFVGLGQTAVGAIGNSDLPVVIGVVLLSTFIVVIANLVVDLLYGVIDPRVRLS